MISKTLLLQEDNNKDQDVRKQKCLWGSHWSFVLPFYQFTLMVVLVKCLDCDYLWDVAALMLSQLVWMYWLNKSKLRAASVSVWANCYLPRGWSSLILNNNVQRKPGQPVTLTQQSTLTAGSLLCICLVCAVKGWWNNFKIWFVHCKERFNEWRREVNTGSIFLGAFAQRVVGSCLKPTVEKCTSVC